MCLIYLETFSIRESGVGDATIKTFGRNIHHPCASCSLLEEKKPFRCARDELATVDPHPSVCVRVLLRISRRAHLRHAPSSRLVAPSPGGFCLSFKYLVFLYTYILVLYILIVYASPGKIYRNNPVGKIGMD